MFIHANLQRFSILLHRLLLALWSWHLISRYFAFYACMDNSNNMSRLMTKPTKWHVRPAKTQISLDIRPVWSESLLSAWRKLGPLATHWAHSEDSDQTVGECPGWSESSLGAHDILLVLSLGGSVLVRPLPSLHSSIRATSRENCLRGLRPGKLACSATETS